MSSSATLIPAVPMRLTLEPNASPPPDASTTEARPALVAVGSTLAQFQLLRELGRGGHGVVYLARDTRLGREVALKVLRPEVVGRADGGGGRLLREARAAAAVSHANLATVFEVGDAGGTIYVAMELLTGVTLRARLRDGALPVDEVVAIASQMLRGLARAHRAGVVHCDLKPDNVMIGDDGVVKVLDFGLARRQVLEARDPLSDAPTVTMDSLDGAVAGTPAYMAPEQARGLAVDTQCDVYGFGAVLFELLVGAPPFAGTTPTDILAAVLRDPAPALATRAPAVPAGLAALVDACLVKEPSARPAGCAALLDALAAAMPVVRASSSAESGPAVAPAPLESAPPTLPDLPPAPPPSPTAAPAPTRRRWPWLAAGLGIAALGVAAVGIGAVLTSSRPSGPPSTPPPPAPEPVSEPRSTAVAITDLPLPTSPVRDAVATYAAALQSLRDANWSAAEAGLRTAVELDPTFAAAHLRLAVLLEYTTGRITATRERFALAMKWRAALDARDQELLATFEPLLVRDPPEFDEFNRRLTAMVAGRPDDAELHALLAYFGPDDPELRLREARRAVELDPRYADGWQAVGKNLATLGRVTEARAAFDTCLQVSPGAVDCRGERALLHAGLGECAEAEADLRQALAASPSGRYWRELRASALIELGKPVDSVIETLAPRWAMTPEPGAELIEHFDRARVALLAGDFAGARSHVTALGLAARLQPDAEIHARHAGLSIDLDLEAGRLHRVAAVADEFLRRREAWLRSGDVDVDSIRMLTTLRQAGSLDDAEFERRRQAWLAAQDVAEGRIAVVWIEGWARPAATRAEAIAALAAAPPQPLGSLADSLTDHAVIGAVLALAGRAAEAVPLLRRAAYGCDGLLAPAIHVRAAFQLGEALEATGDRDGACAAYGRVHDRWGQARPPSNTATFALARLGVLGCAP